MNRNPAVHLRLLPAVKRSPEVHYRRPRKSLAVRIKEAGDSLAVMEGDADWRELSAMLFDGDPNRLLPMETERAGNVIQLPVRRQRSTREEILQVRAEEVCRGVPRKVL